MIVQGESRVFAVRSMLREQVWNWAEKADIPIEYHGMFNIHKDLWRVVNPKDCVMFKLRWA
jgi:hypothetical protein